MSKWKGDSEKNVRLLFEIARFYAPSIVFIDEVDYITGKRGERGDDESALRLKTELLTQITELERRNEQGTIIRS